MAQSSDKENNGITAYHYNQTGVDSTEVGMQTVNVLLYYPLEDGETGEFKFSYEDVAVSDAPIREYMVGYGYGGTDGFSSDDLNAAGETLHNVSHHSLSVNPEWMNKFAEKVLEAGFLEKTGQEKLPDALIPEKNTLETSPGQAVFYYAYLKGLYDPANKGQDYSHTYQFSQVVHDDVVPTSRDKEQVTHRLSLTNRIYCQEENAGPNFAKDLEEKTGQESSMKVTCTSLDDMKDAEVKSLFSMFNKVNMNIADTYHWNDQGGVAQYSGKQAVMSFETAKNTSQRKYTVNWKARAAM